MMIHSRMVIQVTVFPQPRQYACQSSSTRVILSMSAHLKYLPLGHWILDRLVKNLSNQ